MVVVVVVVVLYATALKVDAYISSLSREILNKSLYDCAAILLDWN